MMTKSTCSMAGRRLSSALQLLWLALALPTAAEQAAAVHAPDTMAARVEACAACHGVDGAGSADGSAPALAGRPAGYLLHQLQAFRAGGRVYPPMQLLLTYLQDDYLSAIAAYYAGLPSAPARVALPAATNVTSRAAPIVPPGSAKLRGKARAFGVAAAYVPVDRGAFGLRTATAERLVRHGDTARGVLPCVLCHGPGLLGMQPNVPGLLGLDQRYLAEQLTAWRIGARHAIAPDCMHAVAAGLSPAEIDDVSTWIAGLPRAVPDRPAPAGSLPAALACGSARVAAAAVAPVLPADAQIARGAYIARAGDCVACHTSPDGAAFAGGLGIATPFGTLFASNITPDVRTGIGGWTADEFWRMLHEGRGRDGKLLYPAMPFPAYTKVTRADSDDLFAWLRTLAPVVQANRSDTLRWPYRDRDLMLVWRALFFTEGVYVPQPGRTAAYNRGAYLVEGLGHCAACHTAINALGGSSVAKAYMGGPVPMQPWYAPSLTSNREAGLGLWSLADIATLLRSGVSQRGVVFGPMAEVVHDSLQYLTAADVAAMAEYLKSLPMDSNRWPLHPKGRDEPLPFMAMEAGRKLYLAQCAGCHRPDGSGMPPAYPPLAGNPAIQMASSVNPLRMVLGGGFPPETALDPEPYGMPPFAARLSDAEVAAVVSYIRMSWGNRGGWVTPAEAGAMRAAPLVD